MTPSQIRRQRAAVEAAALLGPTSEQTAAAIAELRRVMDVRRAARRADVRVVWDGVDRRRGDVGDLLDVAFERGERRKYVGTALTQPGAVS